MNNIIKKLLKYSKETAFLPVVIFIILFCITNILALVKLSITIKNMFTSLPSDNKILWDIIWIADLVLVWIVLYVLASWIYDLFIYNKDNIKSEELWMISNRDIDELKERVAKLIIVILIIHVFKSVLTIQISEQLDILFVSLSVLLLAFSIHMINRK